MLPGRGGCPIFVHIGHGREALDNLYIRDVLDIIFLVRQSGAVGVLIGPPGGKKIDDRYPFVDRTGVISGHDVHAVKAPAVEPMSAWVMVCPFRSSVILTLYISLISLG